MLMLKVALLDKLLMSLCTVEVPALSSFLMSSLWSSLLGHAVPYGRLRFMASAHFLTRVPLSVFYIL